MRNTFVRIIAVATLLIAIGALWGCRHNPPMAMAPPMNGGGMNGGAASASGQGVYNWQDVPQGQQVPVDHATFDQGGYQIYASSGETIVVPFANQNLYVMKFGRAYGQPTYFVNEGSAPVLYLRDGDSLANAAAQGARWYPIPADYAYNRPIYVSLAPSWAEYTAMGWYPGMNYYGGMWGYNPYSPGVHFSWMPSFYISLGGRRYTDYTVYHTYYTSHPGYIRTRTVYNYSAPRRTSTFGFGRANGSTGSFGNGRRSAPSGSFGTGRTNGSTGSFGNGRTSAPSGSFGSGGSSSGSFGNTRRSPGGFGSGSSSGSGGSFGSGKRSFGGFGSGSGGSFGRRRH